MVIAVVGLGYVGLPLAVEFGKRFRTVGYDHSTRVIDSLRRGNDPAGGISADDLQAARRLELTSGPAPLADADFVIIAVPTPVDAAHNPDLGPLANASETVARHLKKGATVIYESTVYPGATEETCIPVLERHSGMKWKTDFHVGYSPERINPGDKEHTLARVIKVVAGDSADTLERVANLYGEVVQAGIHRASSIMVAEAAKVIENTQRDLNIAFMNELSAICHRLGIDTGDVLAAAGTKWNFLKFYPGLVGGHCIGVDPYYLTHRAEKVGYHPEVILSGRRINDDVGMRIARECVRDLFRAGRTQAMATILGLTFKENVPDTRNSKVVDIVRELRASGVRVQVHDPLADPAEAKHEYDLVLSPLDALAPADAVIFAVAHNDFVAAGWTLMKRLLKDGKGLVFDVKSVLDRTSKPAGIDLWRL
ncbi:MAG: nucleotide sugar dehydrogenase [Pseudorhodoplanes sp.]|nr:nucleotide sugar dehydrogenase [Pseudorhodoplanes sp.]